MHDFEIHANYIKGVEIYRSVDEWSAEHMQHKAL